MSVKPRKELAAMLPQMKQWMEAMHQEPELSTQEVNTGKYVADLLKIWATRFMSMSENMALRVW